MSLYQLHHKFLTKKKFQDNVNTQTGVKPFSCTVCSKDFHIRYYKSKHEKVCTGETRTACEICGKYFCDMSLLSRHQRTQHQGQQFTCMCGKRFRYKSSLVMQQKNKEHRELLIFLYIFTHHLGYRARGSLVRCVQILEPKNQ